MKDLNFDEIVEKVLSGENISTCTNAKPLEMTLESIKEAIAKITDLPPSLVKMRCSDDTYNYVKIATQAQLKNIIGDSKNYFGYGIDVIKDNDVETGSIENIFSDELHKKL